MKQSILITPFDLFDQGFQEKPQLSTLKMDSMRSDDHIRVYSKPIYDRDTGRIAFDLCVEHRCSNKHWNDFHCFDFYVESDSVSLSRRVTSSMHNTPIADIVSYFVAEFFRKTKGNNEHR